MVCVLHDCPQRLSESLSLLQSLGFRQSASTSSTDNTSVKNLQIKRVWSGQLGIDLVEDPRLSSIRSLTRQRPLTTVLSVDTYGSAAVAAASASAAAERPFPSLLQQAEHPCSVGAERVPRCRPPRSAWGWGDCTRVPAPPRAAAEPPARGREGGLAGVELELATLGMCSRVRTSMVS